MKFIDTHTHLYAEDFDQDRAAVIERALAVGVEKLFLPSIDSNYTKGMLQLKEQYPDNIELMLGLHPTHVKPESIESEMAFIQNNLDIFPICGIGEIGMDLYWDKTNSDLQKEVFSTQIQWAKERDLPIVIHCRDAFEETFEVLEKHAGDKLFGIFHCFTGNLEQAKRAIDLNLHLGIGGVATFKNGKIDKFLDQVSIDHIVLETDSPYLAPTPYRGKRNESAYILNVAEKLAMIYDCDLETIAARTTLNAEGIFNRY